MTELLEKALSRLRERPAADQDRAAEIILALLDQDSPEYDLTPEQEEDVARIQAGLRNGSVRLATDEEVAATWRSFGL
ncbi:hypothetical protein [Enterovirga sp. CN4-39]|uniref:hypothetical protein n=1 Tax=Enterovirga sp. CN4-39 TaxID=3400910 RepID=UPI003BFB4369